MSAWKGIFLIFILLVAVFGWWFFPEQTLELDEEEDFIHQVKTIEVSAGLLREFNVTGEVMAEKSSRLSSELRADLRSILVKLGDKVNKGQLLMKLDSDTLQSALDDAGKSFDNAQAHYDQTRLSVESSKLSADLQIGTAQLALDNLRKNNEKQLAQALEALNSAKLNSKLSVVAASTALDNAIRNVYTVSQNAIIELDKIVGVSHTYELENDAFEGNLGVLKVNTKNNAKSSLEQAIWSFDTYVESYENAINILELTETASKNTLLMLKNSVIGDNYPQANLNLHIATVNTQLNLIQGALSGLRTAANTRSTVAQDVDGISQNILSAEATYRSLKTQLDSAESSALQASEAARAFGDSSKQASDLSVLGAQTALDAARGRYRQAQINFEKLNIRAPFEGKVVNFDLEPGDEVNPGTFLIALESSSLIKITTYLSASEARAIRVGDIVFIDSEQEAQVTSIAPSADPISKKYKVEILKQDSILRPGEFVNLRFTYLEAGDQDRIFVPVTAIKLLPSETFVWTLGADHRTIKTPIQTAEIAGKYIEVTEGLETGMELVIEGGRILEDDGVLVETF